MIIHSVRAYGVVLHVLKKEDLPHEDSRILHLAISILKKRHNRRFNNDLKIIMNSKLITDILLRMHHSVTEALRNS